MYYPIMLVNLTLLFTKDQLNFDIKDINLVSAKSNLQKTNKKVRFLKSYSRCKQNRIEINWLN